MTNSSHEHTAGHHQDHKPKKRPPHKDWRAWVVVVLMLAAMAAYVMSFDESINPEGNVDEPRVPAETL